LALLLSAFLVGFAAGMNPVAVATAVAKGFGGTVEKIGIVIICGTIIGVMLERSSAALTMADTILKVVGKKRPALAMSVIGYITSIPVFCDSGFVILSALNKSLARRAEMSMAVLAVVLSTGCTPPIRSCPPPPGRSRRPTICTPIGGWLSGWDLSWLFLAHSPVICGLPGFRSGFI